MAKVGSLQALVLLVPCLLTACLGEIMFQLMQGQQLRDWEHLLSPRGTFKLGFFNPTSSSYRYLGIWYSKLPHNPEAIWVANPTNPILNSSGVLNLDADGRLKITQNGGQTFVVSSNPPGQGNVTVNLLENGNLVLAEVGSGGSTGRVLWQSFDYPSNQLLPGMKLGLDPKTGRNWTLTSWLSDKDPAPGAFRLGVDPGGTNQLVVWQRDKIYWTSGAWQDGKFQMASELTFKGDLYEFTFVSNEDEKYFSFTTKNNLTISRWEINLWGQLVQSILASDGTTWRYSTTSSCGSNGNYSNAICIDQKPSQCRNNSELFVPQRGYYNRGDLLYSDHNSRLTLSDCHSICWSNCSCVAFGTLFTDGTGCQFWSEGGNFVANDNFDVLYVLTLTNSQDRATDGSSHTGTKKRWWVWLILVAVSGSAVILLGCFLYSRRRTRKHVQQTGQSADTPSNSLLEFKQQFLPSHRLTNTSETIKRGNKKGGEFQLYQFSQVEAATDCFSPDNKLGEGGFGPVYQARFCEARQIRILMLN
ncbi:hypothetical protein CDL15_Pgr015453 [Punica granatum]|uniref:non-specific serine/threonine protein kinase n=1 Tax=Punica granatum TaxID=22663 RepID=A0A218VZL6_PUNGR|nr:hypothetical protein CDL15_Pgr015453 [Punica granatum]